jgi:nitrate reductase gamma subunit
LESILDFARGPLFRISFAIMVLGLARNVFLALWGVAVSYYQAGNKDVPFKAILKRTFNWIVPFKQLYRVRPTYSIISFIFHIGLILVPVFLYAHVSLWRGTLGFGWPSLPLPLADALTVITVIAALALFCGRVFHEGSRRMSGLDDFFWPLLLAVPFVSGFFCVHPTLLPLGYSATMLIHVLSAELIFVLIPFTKIAHCVLMPMSQLISDLGWRFPADSGEKVEIALGKKKGAPV